MPAQWLDEVTAIDLTANSPGVQQLPFAAQALLAERPGVRACLMDLRVAAFYGAAIVEAANPDEAERQFWLAHADAFGVAELTVEGLRAGALDGGRMHVFAYRQLIEGLPVEYTSGRVLVRVVEESSRRVGGQDARPTRAVVGRDARPTQNARVAQDVGGTRAKVVYAAGKYAPTPSGPFPPIGVSDQAAISLVSSMKEHAGLTVWSDPELVVFAGEEWQWTPGPHAFGEPVRAWKFTGETPTFEDYARRTFFVDATSGALLHSRDEVCRADVTGTVQGYATPITTCGDPPGPCARPDISGNPPTLRSLADILVEVSGGNSAHTDANGEFTIAHGGTDPVTLTVSLADGRWVSVGNSGGGTLALSQQVTPGTPASFVFNPGPHSPNSTSTAQVNAFAYVNQAHAFFSGPPEDWTGLDYPLIVTTNVAGQCNAFFTGTGLRFYEPSDGCANTAYSSIIAHEYGHFVVNQLGLVQGAFGEGFSDACSILMFDDPVFARDVGGTPTRDYSPGQPEKTYPCNETDIYQCNRVLAGLWRDIREQFGHLDPSDPEYAATLQTVRSLFLRWTLMTNGQVAWLGPGPSYPIYPQAAHALTIREILMADDPDGNLANGTPNCTSICAAAAAHGLACVRCSPSADPPDPSGVGWQLAFQSPRAWYSGAAGGIDPFGVAVGDLNGDTYKDVVLACEASDNVLVYLRVAQLGTVEFQAPIAYEVGSQPARIKLDYMSLDANPPDGSLDIIVTLQGDNGVRILVNLGDGTFNPNDPAKSRFEPTQGADATPVLNPVGLAILDWDGNGRSDIAVAGYQGTTQTRATLGLLWATAAGTFDKRAVQASLTGGKGYGLTDWVLEVPTEGPGFPQYRRLTMTDPVRNPYRMYNFRYASGPTFIEYSTVTLAGPSIDVVAVDLNGPDADGVSRVDLACCVLHNGALLTDGIQWFKRAANGMYTASGVTPLYGYPWALAAGLLTRTNQFPGSADALPDLAVATFSDAAIRILANKGNEGPQLARLELNYFPTDLNVNASDISRGVVVVDMNADGVADVVTANQGPQSEFGESDPDEGFTVLLNRPN